MQLDRWINRWTAGQIDRQVGQRYIYIRTVRQTDRDR